MDKETCWCGKEHLQVKHHVANWKLYFIRIEDMQARGMHYGKPREFYPTNRRKK